MVRGAFVCCVLGVLSGATAATAQEPSAPQTVSPEQLRAAINKLGDLDYVTRTAASRTVRRVPGAQAVPALLQAVAGHTHGNLCYPTLVPLPGFHDPPTQDPIPSAPPHPPPPPPPPPAPLFPPN